MNILRELLDLFNIRLWIEKKKEQKRARDILDLIIKRQEETAHLSPAERKKENNLKKLLEELKNEEEK